MLHMLSDACDSLITEQPEFWLVAGLTDASFETGQLRLGINGNLALIMERTHSVRAEVRRGSIRPDICIDSAEGETVIEIKLLYDMTIPAYYGHKDGHGVADDREKLLNLRREGFGGKLFQIVFFLELTSYDYPSGRSFAPEWEAHGSRKSYPGLRGITAQYQRLLQFLGRPATPADAPRVHHLPLPAKGTCEALNRWYSEVFRPDMAEWRFQADVQLARAAAGFAIWQY
jgi:hypothetical protein